MRIFALLTTSGTAIPDTAICAEHKDSVTGQSIAIGNAGQWAADWDRNEELTDCTGNDQLHCQICGAPW